MSVQVKVPGKMILLGEYAVLEGAGALVMAVDRYVNVSVQDSPEADDFQINTNLNHTSFHFRIDKSGMIHPHPSESEGVIKKMNFACQAVEAICIQLVDCGVIISPFSIKINTEQFYLENYQKLGLGSSAAVIVAIIVALSRYHQAEKKVFANDEELFDLCFKTHVLAQGNRGSGIDVAASVFGGIVEYLMPQSCNDTTAQFHLYKSLHTGLYLVPIWTGISTSTRSLLAKVDYFRSENPVEFELIMDKMIDLSNKGCDAFKKEEIHSFLDIVHEYYQVLLKFTQRSAIPVISEIHKNIADIVHDSGGIYKPSGAGEGDLGIAFCDSLDKLKVIKDRLKQNQFETLSLSISKSGIS